MKYHNSKTGFDTARRILKGNHVGEFCAALNAIEAILEDEQNHADTAFSEGGGTTVWYKPLRISISAFTDGVIGFGVR